jgi:hypothetical protein
MGPSLQKRSKTLIVTKEKETPSTPDWAAVEMSPTAKAYYKNTFVPQYETLIRQISETPLTVLVWGPGVSGGDLYQKRLQIRAQLRQAGCAAIFSEEIDSNITPFGFSAKANEMCQAKAADFIVIIQSSPGSTAEAHDFAEFVADIGRKMLIFVDERAKEGYSYSGALEELRTLYHSVETYKYPEDIQECNLTRSVQKKVQTLQAVKWRSSIK